ncbi:MULTISPECIES: DUF2514 family protein [unclassified Pseudomonas]|jgi:hypothetical protein|uniref:DUF2514 family protein n=1 Tax=Pseudomonas TaxID=286 RepID=UPI000C8850BD|nr:MULTISPECIES: DUF2514 family protein [unclassified Pseudomonas]MBL1311292.1 DUF2514 domain-containing protein [Pseudomonas sp.]PMX19083.1 DUF2514 domain-containing protein [Pseudomonas sp. MPBC4-3]PMX50044.1 DUF2514 domain-containing protein [Pseudomonas sp. FW301-21B01]PMY10760.1 DUF2514 domain-containing protein [Pseudomonas sp. MPR-R5A]PNA72927.1 DUF2514 domain-containing protein [Pseudomonas sp. MPR-R5B]
MNTILLKSIPYIAAVLLALGVLYGAYHHGVSVTNDDWQAKWSARDTDDATAKAVNEAAARDKEQAWQLKLDKVTEDGQHAIDQAVGDAATARASADSLRGAADNLAARLAVGQAGSHSCTAAASAAATRAVMVLADVLKRADQRAGDLAGFADQSHSRGVTCEQAYDAIYK